jgi:hypothetical protein
MDKLSRPIPAQVAYLASGAEQRHTRRRAVNFAAILESEGVACHPVSVLDISEQGFRIVTVAEVAQGSSMLIKLPGLEAVRATVVWARDGQIGCSFQEELHPASIRTLAVDPREGSGRLSARAQFGSKLAN